MTGKSKIKRIALGNFEEKLLSYLEYKKLTFVSKNDLKTINDKFVHATDLDDLIERMIKKNRLKSIIKGKYFVIPMRAINKKWAPTEVELIKYFMQDHKYYFGLSIAFNQHNFTDQIPIKVFIFNSKYSFDKTILNYRVKMIKIKKSRLFGFSNSIYPISDKERTIIDALEYPEYLGGLDTVIDILHNQKFNLKKLEEYVIKYKSIKIIKLVGLITNSNRLYKYLVKNKKLYYTTIKNSKIRDKKWKIRPI